MRKSIKDFLLNLSDIFNPTKIITIYNVDTKDNVKNSWNNVGGSINRILNLKNNNKRR